MRADATGAACANGCKLRAEGGTKAPARCEGARLLCSHCTERLEGWLESVMATWPLLRGALEHGAVAPDPDGIRTPTIDAPAPMRLEVVDALDTRPTLGPTGVLTRWAVLLRNGRNLRPLCRCRHSYKAHAPRRCVVGGCPCELYRPAMPTARSEAQLILGHLDWVVGQPWAARLYRQVREVDRELRAVVGEYRKAPVGRCTVLEAERECGGPLMPREYGGVACARCHAQWHPDELRRLGLILEQPA